MNEGKDIVTLKKERRIKLSEGSGGREMHALVEELTTGFERKDWKGTMDDAAHLTLADGKKLFFTTDSYVVSPEFFPGGNIGKIAFCGTVNDLVVSGATPLGIALSLILEEGYEKEKVKTIIASIEALSKETGIPIVTGDTKVLEKGSVDKIIINTSGVGMYERALEEKITPGDKMIVSGSIGDHGTALLAKRFELESELVTDSKPLVEEMRAIREKIKCAKDITRGGLAAILNELAKKGDKKILINEEDIPLKRGVKTLTEVLGIEAYNLACEGRLVCVVAKEKASEVLEELQKINPEAAIIGEVMDAQEPEVIIQTKFGKKILSMPSGNIVPRIC